ncbi:hypothetical protein WJX77_012514 [Trebouxia sp. C0004]
MTQSLSLQRLTNIIQWVNPNFKPPRVPQYAGLLWHLILVMSAGCTLRAAVVLSIWLHEAAHLVAAVMLGDRTSLTAANISGNTSGHAWLACLNPVQTLPRSLQPHIVLELGSQTYRSEQQLQLKHPCPLVCPLGLHSNQADSMQDSMIHAAGWIFSCACALCLQQMHHLTLAVTALPPHASSWQSMLLSQIVNGFWVTAVAAVASDLFGYNSVNWANCDDQTTFNCGNFGIMLADACNQSVDVVKVLYSMSTVCMARGAQSGGLVVQGRTLSASQSGDSPWQETAVRVRVASSRRGNVAANMSAALQRKLRWQCMKRLWPACQFTQPVPLLCAGHCRFATSSIPTPAESHPHQWTPSVTSSLWLPCNVHHLLAPLISVSRPGDSQKLRACKDSSREVGAGPAPEAEERQRWQLQPVSRPHGVFVTHNGDFESYELFGRKKTCAEVMAWLSAVLHVPAPADCDSVAIAGLIDLMRTQGLWVQSLRLAFQQCTGGAVQPKGAHQAGWDIERGLPACEPPTPSQLQAVATIAEKSLTSFLRRPRSEGFDNKDQHSSSNSVQGQMCAALGGSSGIQSAAEHLTAAFCEYAQQAGQDEAWLKWLAAHDKWYSLCNIAMLGFVQNDLFWAVRQFLDNAHGSFGLAVMSEVDTGSLVLAAYKQPMTLTFAPHTGAVLYSSEAQATLQPLTSFVASAPVPPQATPKAQVFGLGKTDRTDIRPPTYRIDMDDSSGEVYLLKYKSRAALIEQPCGAGIEPSMAVLGSFGSQNYSLPATAASADANATTVWPLFVDRTDVKIDLGDSARFRTSKADTNIAGCYGCQTKRPGSTPESHLSLHIAMYNVAERRLIDRQDFAESRKLVSMQNNTYMPMQSNLPPQIAKRWKHQAERDLAEIPAVLGALAATWQDPKSFNCQSACELAKMLQVAMSTSKHTPAWSARYAQAHDQAMDLVIVGVEASLWTAEQFAQDLKAVLPALQITVVSSNKLIAMLEHSASAVTTADLSSGRLGISLDKQRTSVVCISHSGQTFPTIQAARVLSSHLPGRVFVMTGSIDTKMSLAVAQQTWQGAPFTRRIFVTNAGWRQTEPASLTAVATHHCLSELLMYIVSSLLGAQQPADSITEVLLSRKEVESLRMVQNGCLSNALPDLIGWNQNMAPVKSDVHTELVKQGRWWALHVLEAPWAWLLAAVYIAATVISTHPPFISIANASGVHDLRWLGHVLDSLVYMFSPVLCCFLLRILQGRPLLARLGRRTVLILDIPYVHQLLEAYVTKLLALSYGVASVDVHSADPTDHFVHCFTHRVVRGLLLAVGRPDGRLCSQTKNESWVMLGLQQAKAIRSLGCSAEAVTMGHNPHSKASAMDRSVVLPTTCHHLFCEDCSIVGLQDQKQPSQRQAALNIADQSSKDGMVERLVESRFGSLERLVAMQVMFYNMAARIAGFWPLCFSVDRSQSCLRIATTASPVSAADLKST